MKEKRINCLFENRDIAPVSKEVLRNYILTQLQSLTDPKYRDFSLKLNPECETMIGVRLPLLRNIAKEIAHNNWRLYLEDIPNTYYEEIQIQGMVLQFVKDADFDEWLEYVKKQVNRLTNWSTCDCFVCSLKTTNKHLEEMLEFLQPYLHSHKPYELRFGAVMLLDYFITKHYINTVLISLDGIHHDEYYVKMAVAWALSVSYVKFPSQTIAYLKERNNLDNFTFNKTLQKITESYRVDTKEKEMIRKMKRK